MSEEQTPGPWYARKIDDKKTNVYTELGLHNLGSFKKYEDAELVVRIRNSQEDHEKDKKLIATLFSILEFEHRDAVGEDHFDRVIAGELVCSVCSFIKKSKTSAAVQP